MLCAESADPRRRPGGRWRPDVRTLLDRSGLTAKIGPEHIFVRPLHGIVLFRMRRGHDACLTEDLAALRALLEKEAARPGTDGEVLALPEGFERRISLVQEAAGTAAADRTPPGTAAVAAAGAPESGRVSPRVP